MYKIQPFTVNASEITVAKNEKLNIDKLKEEIQNKEQLEQYGTLSYNDSLDTQNPGKQNTNIQYTVNGESIDIPVVVNIEDTLSDYASQNNPISKDIYVLYKHTLTDEDAKSQIKNNAKLKNVISYAYKEKPDTSIPSEYDVVILVAYKDNSVDEISAKLNVFDAATTYIPESKSVSVEKEKNIDAKDTINTNNLPEGTTYTWHKKPDTSLEGYQNGQVLVTYPDKSIDIVSVSVNVIDSLNIKKYKSILNRLENIDERVINFSKDGFFLENNLAQSYMTNIYKIFENGYVDGQIILGGTKIGANFNVLKNLKLGAFAEYDYDGLHNIGIGTMYNASLNKFDIDGFLRYRYMTKATVSVHNFDIYNRFSYIYDKNFYAKVNGAILLSYGSSSMLDDEVSVDSRYTLRADFGARLGYKFSHTMIYIEPKGNVKYTPSYTIRNSVKERKLKVSPNVLFGSIEVGANHKISNFVIRESLSFDSLAKLNFNFGFSYNF